MIDLKLSRLRLLSEKIVLISSELVKKDEINVFGKLVMMISIVFWKICL